MKVARFVLIVLIIACYLLPTFLAVTRDGDHQNTIFSNLPFGWTAIGWIDALVWAIVEIPIASNPRNRVTFPEVLYK